MEFMSNMYVKVITLPGFYSAFWVAFSTAIDIPDDKGGMAMDILFKPRVEATEQMAQNCMDISRSKNQRERKITSKWHVQTLYVVVISCFQFYLTPENPSRGNSSVEYRWRERHKMFFWKHMNEKSQVLFFLNLYWILIGKYLIRYFLLILS